MIQTVNTCINCTNMTESLLCAKHNVEVEANNTCGDHQVKDNNPYFLLCNIIYLIICSPI